MSDSILFNLDDKKEKIIDIFTTFYGEDYKELIEYKLNKVLIINSYNFFSLINSQNSLKKELLEVEEKIVNYFNKKLQNQFPNTKPELLFSDDCFLEYGLMEYFRDDLKGERYNQKKIEYFKTIGIDLGDNYQNYLKNEQAKSKIPSKKVLNALNNFKNNLEEQYFFSLNSLASSYNKIKDYFEKENYIINQERIWDIIKGNDPSTIPLVKKPKTIVLVIFMDTLETEESFGDRGLIHELNHCLSYSLLKTGKKHFNYQMGFLSFFGETSQDTYGPKVENELDEFDLFNEIINDLISFDVLSILRKEDLTIINDNYKHSTYETFFPIIKPFYLNFKDEIKHFYLTNDFKRFYKNVNDKKMYKLIKVLKKAYKYVEKLDDQELIDLNEFEKEANKIVSSMTNKKMKRTI